MLWGKKEAPPHGGTRGLALEEFPGTPQTGAKKGFPRTSSKGEFRESWHGYRQFRLLPRDLPLEEVPASCTSRFGILLRICLWQKPQKGPSGPGLPTHCRDLPLEQAPWKPLWCPTGPPKGLLQKEIQTENCSRVLPWGRTSFPHISRPKDQYGGTRASSPSGCARDLCEAPIPKVNWPMYPHGEGPLSRPKVC